MFAVSLSQQSSKSHRARWLRNNVLFFPKKTDGLSDFLIGNSHHIVEEFLAKGISQPTCLANRGAIAEMIDLIQQDRIAGL